MGEDDAAMVVGDTSFGGRLSRIGRGICNTEKGEFLGRTPSSWVKIIVFYIFFYAALVGFFAAMMAGFFSTVDTRYPTQTNMYSLLKMNPGMGFKPRSGHQSTLIKFKQTDNKTYSVYISDLNEYLNKYMEPQNGTVVNCGAGGSNSSNEQVCKVPSMSEYGPCKKEEDYGFKHGTPCVLLKINKVINFMPEAFGANTSDTEDQAMRRKQAKEIIPGGVLPTDHIAVTCQGLNPADEDSLHEVNIYPSKGLPFNWFPYTNQVGYRPPIVFAQMNNFAKGVVIQVWCKMWARNIKHHKNDRAGSVYFEIMMD